MKNSETYIGRVVSLSGGTISVQLDDSIYKSLMPIINGIVYRIGQIGSFVKIPIGYSSLYGVVTQAGASAIPEKFKDSFVNHGQFVNNRWLTIVLIGEMLRGKFERGIAQFPTSEDEVHLVTVDDLAIIYGNTKKSSSICIGQISASESLPANLDLDKLITRHCAILGSTGSGKSNAVSVIINAIADNKDLNSQRIIIIDPHGEYNEALKEHSRVFRINADIKEGQNELFIPYWALPFEELISVFSGRLSDLQKDYIRSQIVARKISASKLFKNKIDESSITSDSPIPFSIKKLWFDLDDFERQTFQDNGRVNKTSLTKNGDPEKLISNIYPGAAPGGGAPFLNNRGQGILSFLDSVRNRILDERFKFLFRVDSYEPTLHESVSKDLDDLICNWLGNTKKVTILDLSGIPAEIMETISGALLKIIYDALFWGQNFNIGGRKQPLLVVLEEAHNYLKSDKYSMASKTVQTIAKEGRKYGVGLLLVTQRPSELDETTLSQCGSVIALRMTNNRDRSFVSSAIQDDLQDLISVLPSLRTGEAIVVGELVKIPSRIKFNKALSTPKSSDPIVTAEWSKPRPNEEEYEKVVALWRTGKFK